MADRRIRRVVALVALSVLVTGAGSSGSTARTIQGPATSRLTVVATDPRTEDLTPVERAMAAARTAGTRQRVGGAESETETVYANPDGTFTSEMSVLPTRVRAKNGRWVRPDATLSLDASGEAFRPLASQADMAFSSGGTRTPLVHYGLSGAAIDIRWPRALPKPVLSGTGLIYRDVLPGVDLELRASEVGFAKRWIVRTKEAAKQPALRELVLPVTMLGARLHASASGAVSAIRPDGHVSFASGSPVMWDSSISPRRSRVALDLNDDAIVLRPKASMLDDPTTTYPVSIDPDLGPGLYGLAVVSRGYPDEAYWQGGADAVAKVGSCTGWYGCNGADIHRSYFQWNTSSLVGKRVLSAELNAFENYAPSCTAMPVEAKATEPLRQPLQSGTTWRTQPRELASLGSRSVAHGYSASCPPAWVGWNAMSAFPKDGGGVPRANAQTTVVLRAPVTGGVDYETNKLAWKKFARNPSLVVTYNTPPAAPHDSTNEAGVPCGSGPTRAYVNPIQTGGTPRGVRLGTTVSDPDGGRLRVRFEWRALGSGTTLWTTYSAEDASGSTFYASVPAQHVVDGQSYMWRSTGNDSLDDGPSTPWCEVTIDRSLPVTPSVSSVDGVYLECQFPDDATDDQCQHRGGVGRAGLFRLASSPDVTAFRYMIEGGVTTDTGTVQADGGVAEAAPITPPSEGTVKLVVWAVDRAKNVSAQPRIYWLKVGGGSGPVGYWHLDGIAEGVAPDATTGHRDGLVDRTTSSWVAGRVRSALKFAGSGGIALGETPTVHTNASFTVSAWANLASTDTSGVVLSQNGSTHSGYQLAYLAATKSWSFGFRTSPTASTAVRVQSRTTAITGRWTHLIGSYNASTRTLRLHVDGVDQGSATVTNAWDASGPAQVGRNQHGGGYVDYFRGAVDEVRIYDRILAAPEVHDLAVVDATSLELRLPFEPNTPTGDVSGHYRNLSTEGDVSWVAGRRGDPAAGPGQAMHLNGGLANTPPLVRTDSSLTVSTWVKLDALCEDPDDICWETPPPNSQTVFDLRGTKASALAVHFDGANSRWQVTRDVSDSIGAARSVVLTGSAEVKANAWTLLTLVQDISDGQVRLYVGRTPLVGAAPPAPWPATGSLRIGATGSPLDGAVDETRVWAGVRTADQIETTLTQPPAPLTPIHDGQLTRFQIPGASHVVTTGPVFPAARWEASLGFPAAAGEPGTRTIYSCRNGASDYFLSSDERCEGRTMLGAVGGFYVSEPAEGALPVYRCLVSNWGHFASPQSDCEGQRVEGLLGWTIGLAHLVRYVNNGAPYDHMSSPGKVPPQYDAESSLGLMPTRDVASTESLLTLRSCRDPVTADLFASTDPSCEEASGVGVLGYLWASPPEDGPARRLLRCVAPSGERFEQSVPADVGEPEDLDCGTGARYDRTLGYLKALS